MPTVDTKQVRLLVQLVAETVIDHFLAHFTTFANNGNASYLDFRDIAAEAITIEIAGQWRQTATSEDAEDAVEAMYNAARAELVRLLGLEGGTVEFGKGDIQPLTDQRVGQGEAWDAWLEQMHEDNWGDEPGYYVDGEHYSVSATDVVEHLYERKDDDLMVQLRLPNAERETWTRAIFLAEHD